MSRSKPVSLLLLVLAETAGMSVWFMAAAILPDLVREAPVSPARLGWMSSAVQAGFVAGALFVAITGIADRLDPRRVFALSSFGAAGCNLLLVFLPPGGDAAILARFLTGAFLAGVYPVGMKIAVGWGTKDRGLLVGLLVGALTFGKAAPYFLSFLAGADWRAAVTGTSALAALGGLLVLAAGLGPAHARAARFHPGAIRLAWTDRRIRHAYLGYLGHMWELFAMWAWVGAAATASYALTLGPERAASLGKLTAFLAIGLGAPFCVLAGAVADRIGKAEVTIIAMAASGAAAVLTALSFGGPAWLTFALVVVWGIAVIPDSAQFSAIVADSAPPQLAGSLLTFQTALGFALTILTVQVTPLLAAQFGWPSVLAVMAIGPAVGAIAMLPLRRGAAGLRGGTRDPSGSLS